MAATITQESLSDKVYTIIKQQILSGELKGGTLLSEEAFAEQFGVSRTPIREALRRLNEYGLVKLKPHSQAVVHKVDEKEFADITRPANHFGDPRRRISSEIKSKRLYRKSV